MPCPIRHLLPWTLLSRSCSGGYFIAIIRLTQSDGCDGGSSRLPLPRTKTLDMVDVSKSAWGGEAGGGGGSGSTSRDHFEGRRPDPYDGGRLDPYESRLDLYDSRRPGPISPLPDLFSLEGWSRSVMGFLGRDPDLELVELPGHPKRSGAIVDSFTPVNPYLSTGQPRLDPQSEEFSLKDWAKNLMGVMNEDPDRYPRLGTGFSFLNLDVDGSGSALDTQATIPTYLLGLVGRVMQRWPKYRQPRAILQNFDGLVKQGELLLVLGRPGR